MSAEDNNDGSSPATNAEPGTDKRDWPPAGQQASQVEEHVITNCPHCNRKLLSTRSIMCNWCGKRIDDPEYLERAAAERAAQDAKERTDIEQELDATARYGIRGYLKQQAKNPVRSTPPVLFPEDVINKK